MGTMTTHLSTVLLIIFFITSCLILETYGDTDIEIQPQHILDIAPSDVTITCRPKDIAEKARQILLIQIFRKGENPIAEAHPDLNPSEKETPTNSDYKVEGHIDKNVMLSTLNVTLLKPTKDKAGTYTCKVYYLDYTGSLVQDSSDAKLTVTKTDPAIVESILGPLLKKISSIEETSKFLKDKTLSMEKTTTLLQKETNFLKKKTAKLQDETAFLKDKSASLEKERDSLKKKTKSLERKISILEGRATSIENEASSLKNFAASVAEDLTSVVRKHEGQSKKIQSLFDAESTLDKKLGESKAELNSLQNRVVEKTQISSIDKRVAVLEQHRKQEKTDDVTTKASMTSLTKRVGSLERQQKDRSTQIRSLVIKDSSMENGLKTTDQKLSKEMAYRKADKASLTSTIKKVSATETKTIELSKLLRALTSRNSAVEKRLQETDNKISKEVTNRLSDKATTANFVKRVGVLEKKGVDGSKQIKALTDKNTALNERLVAIEVRDGKQSQDIRRLSNSLKNSVSPAVVASLQQSTANLSRQLNGIKTKDSGTENRLALLESKHVSIRCRKRHCIPGGGH